ncbi:MAG: 16S rRNA (guanine(966)-N(2))-methyltransferase RsmD [Sphingomonas sanxanigenens]|uniref:16S rRNA (Guanine(966)-N(2))-methyltransferase RsmD n=1 Tax=Sphingomonas sanxanigenens TaxID=397260 RepID=A0A2W5AAA3_9SPHN|nr:MAG: 16S rRNA (guanine(966)-N(2))-methyltransferase RsmD [Sphingomonas sanxanigenens]
MRIIAGEWRGRSITAPAGDATRPTADRMREALFSMLASRLGDFEGLAVADLFAGTGALGLEALSRGAARCTFVEQDRAALAALKGNAERLGAGGRAAIRAQSATSFVGGPFDLVLLDPPYNKGLGAQALEHLRKIAAVTSATLLSLETAKGEPADFPGYVVETDRTYGKARLLLLRPE